MSAFIVKVNGRRVDEVVFASPKTAKEAFDALVKAGYNPKTLKVIPTRLGS